MFAISSGQHRPSGKDIDTQNVYPLLLASSTSLSTVACLYH
uniref:Uncharacterized protein n=1 Tax=Arundo donax TaxID=35708 RepID=A0A0A9E6C2_ARUDO